MATLDDLIEGNSPAASPLLMTIIVPTYNASQHVDATCESLLIQKDCQIEVLFVDGGSTDRTVEIVQSYNHPLFHIQSLGGSSVFERINRGIYMARGSYICTLMPGDTYLYPTAIAMLAHKLTQAGMPELFYSAAYLEDKQKQSLYFEPFGEDELKMGREPTQLESTWVKASLFKRVGRFSLAYKERAAFDFFCRVRKVKDLKIAFQMRVYVDSSIRIIDRWHYFLETVSIIRAHFGLWATLKWLFHKKSQRS